jgi:hypothetical protein
VGREPGAGLGPEPVFVHSRPSWPAPAGNVR